jgi:hypothetical protein
MKRGRFADVERESSSPTHAVQKKQKCIKMVKQLKVEMSGHYDEGTEAAVPVFVTGAV